MASRDPKISKQCNAGKRKPVSWIPQKLKIIRRLEHGKSRSMVITSYSIGWSTVWYKETKGPVTIICGIKCKV
jgi:hypothetical protein